MEITDAKTSDVTTGQAVEKTDIWNKQLVDGGSESVITTRNLPSEQLTFPGCSSAMVDPLRAE